MSEPSLLSDEELMAALRDSHTSVEIIIAYMKERQAALPHVPEHKLAEFAEKSQRDFAMHKREFGRAMALLDEAVLRGLVRAP